MAEPRRIRVMISSRAETTVPFPEGAQKLQELREELRKKLEKVKLFGKQLFDVWISGEAEVAPGSERDVWRESLREVRRADVVLVLYNGDAGWAIPDGTIGICHDELREALDQAPAKVRIIEIPRSEDQAEDSAEAKRNERFREWIEDQALWRTQVKTKAKLDTAARSALRAGMDDLIALGSLGARKGSLAFGTSLRWDLLSFEARRKVMRQELRAAMRPRSVFDDLSDAPEHGMVVKLRGDVTKSGRRRMHQVYFHCDAIPAAMGIAAAREMVGQPFLGIHQQAERLKHYKAKGPVHLIGCHRTVTESQAMRILGFPDATIISAPFGIYVADDLQKIQMLFVPGCRHPSAIHSGVQRMFMWLSQSGEEIRLAERADSRYRILQAIHGEQPDNARASEVL